MKNILIVGLLLMVLPLYSQEHQREYLQGKEFLKEGQYSLAMESFKPLVRPGNDNPLAKYAMYYYAVAAYKEGYPALAKDMLLQVQELYPGWDQVGEAKLWLARIYFDNEQYNQALNTLQGVKGRKLQDQKEAMLKFYVSQINNLYALDELYKYHPDNKFIARRYAGLLAAQPIHERDQELLTDIIKKFRFNADEFDAGIIEKTVYKDQYRVAVMLPFVYETIDISLRKKKNQFVLDIYNGIRMAVDTLERMGIDIELYAYDTRREYNTTAEILEREEMKTMDLIIGPLYPEPLKLVQDFSFRNKINLINPLSNNPSVVSSNPFSFLFKPSYSTIGRAIGEYAANEVENPYGIVLYGDSEADLLLAQAYKESFEADSINQIVLMEKISSSSPRRVLDILTSSGQKLANPDDKDKETMWNIAPDSIGSVFVATDEELIITRVLSSIETRPDAIKIFGVEKWLDIKAIDYSALERLNVSMAAPTHVDYSGEWFNKFRKSYIHTHKETPSEFAVLGYDLMMFTGTVLNKHGKYFQLAMNKTPALDGFIFTGYKFKSSNDNQIVPIVKVVNNTPQIIVIKNYATNEQE